MQALLRTKLDQADTLMSLIFASVRESWHLLALPGASWACVGVGKHFWPFRHGNDIP